jgi:hypothetical protein
MCTSDHAFNGSKLLILYINHHRSSWWVRVSPCPRHNQNASFVCRVLLIQHCRRHTFYHNTTSMRMICLFEVISSMISYQSTNMKIDRQLIFDVLIKSNNSQLYYVSLYLVSNVHVKKKDVRHLSIFKDCTLTKTKYNLDDFSWLNNTSRVLLFHGWWSSHRCDVMRIIKNGTIQTF